MFKSNDTPPDQRVQKSPALDWKDPEDTPAPEEVLHVAPKRSVNEVEVPWFEMKQLPSQFRAYPAGTKVWYRPYTYNEIETLSTDSPGEIKRFLFIADGIRCEGIDPLDLTMGDFVCIAMYRKFGSMGTEEVNIAFEFEGQVHNHVMRASQLEFDDLEVDLPIIMDVDLPNHDDVLSVEFMPVTLKQHLGYLNIPADVRANIPPQHAWLALGSDQPLEDMLNFVANATGEVMQMLTSVDVALYHGISDLIVPIKSNETNPDWVKMEMEKAPDMVNPYPQFISKTTKQIRVEVKEDSILITPFRRAETASKNGLRFGRRGDS